MSTHLSDQRPNDTWSICYVCQCVTFKRLLSTCNCCNNHKRKTISLVHSETITLHWLYNITSSSCFLSCNAAVVPSFTQLYVFYKIFIEQKLYVYCKCSLYMSNIFISQENAFGCWPNRNYCRIVLRTIRNMYCFSIPKSIEDINIYTLRDFAIYDQIFWKRCSCKFLLCGIEQCM